MRSYSNLSHTLDFQEFITRQQAFVEERKQHVEAQRAARPVKPAWISPGSERILKQKQVSRCNVHCLVSPASQGCPLQLQCSVVLSEL
jgi:hypothetical protein